MTNTQETVIESPEITPNPNVALWQGFVDQYNGCLNALQRLNVDVAHKNLINQQFHLGFAAAEFALRMSLQQAAQAPTAVEEAKSEA